MEKLKLFLSQHGNIEVLSPGYVFTLLLTGKNLSKAATWLEIQKAVLDEYGNIYPIIQVFKNEDHFLLMVLRQQRERKPTANKHEAKRKLCPQCGKYETLRGDGSIEPLCTC